MDKKNFHELLDPLRQKRAASRFRGLPAAPFRKGFARWPTSLKIFASLLLCLTGFSYLILLASIWSDTGMRIAQIAEAYGTMDTIELVEHSFKYLFWFMGTFGIAGFLFLLTSYPEKIKRVFAVLIPALIFSDVGSAWLIRDAAVFAWVLAASGFLLAVSFLLLFFLIQCDLWLRKTKHAS